MKKNQIALCLALLLMPLLLTAKDKSPKIQSWINKGRYLENSFKDSTLKMVQFSNDGSKIFCANMDGDYYTLDAKTGDELNRFKYTVYKNNFDHLKISDFIHELAYDETNNLLLVLHQNRPVAMNLPDSIKVSAFRDSQLIYTFGDKFYTDPSIGIYGSTISVNYKLKIDSKNNRIYLSSVQSFAGEKLDVSLGTQFFTKTGYLLRYNLSTGLGKVTFDYKFSNRDMDYSRDGKYLLSANSFHYDRRDSMNVSFPLLFESNFSIYDAAGFLLWELDTSKSKYYTSSKVAFGSSSDKIVTYRDDSLIKVWDINSKTLLRQRPVQNVSSILATKEANIFLINRLTDPDPAILFINIDNNNFIDSIKFDSPQHAGKIICRSEDGKSIAVLGRDSVMRVFTSDIFVKPLVSRFDADKRYEYLDKPIKFFDQSLYGATAFHWDFGDGSASSEKNPTHEYRRLGDFTVKLIVSKGSYSDTCISEDFIHIIIKPKSKFEISSRSGDVPCTVKFRNLSEGTIKSYAWQFPDGSESAEFEPTKIFQTCISGRIKLIVNDSASTDTSYTDITTAYAPSANFNILRENEFTRVKKNITIINGIASRDGDFAFCLNGANENFPSEIYKLNNSQESVAKFIDSTVTNFIETADSKYIFATRRDIVKQYEVDSKGYIYKESDTGHIAKQYYSYRSSQVNQPITSKMFLKSDSGCALYYIIENTSQVCVYDKNLTKQNSIFYEGQARVQLFDTLSKDDIYLYQSTYGFHTTFSTFSKWGIDGKILTETKCDTLPYTFQPNNMFHLPKIGTILLGIDELDHLNYYNAVLNLYDDKGKIIYQYHLDSLNTVFNDGLMLNDSVFAFVGDTKADIGIYFLNLNSKNVEYKAIEGRKGYLNSISKSTDGRILVTGATIISDSVSSRKNGYYALIDGSGISIPKARFEIESKNGDVPCMVKFKNNSSGKLKSYFWDFGDGTTSREKNPLKEYFVCGQRPVKLIVSDSLTTDSASNDIEINYPAPDKVKLLSDFEFSDGIKNYYISQGVECRNGDLAMSMFTSNGLPTDSNTCYLMRLSANGMLSQVKTEKMITNFIEMPDNNFMAKGYSFSTDKMSENLYVINPDGKIAQSRVLETKSLPNLSDNNFWLSLAGNSIKASGDGSYIYNGKMPIKTDNKLNLLTEYGSESNNCVFDLTKSNEIAALSVSGTKFTLSRYAPAGTLLNQTEINQIDKQFVATRLLASKGSGYLALGSTKITGLVDNEFASLYYLDDLGKELFSFRSDKDSTKFRDAVQLDDSLFAIVGDMKPEMGIYLFNNKDYKLTFLKLNGRIGEINSISRTADNKIFISGTTVYKNIQKGYYAILETEIGRFLPVEGRDIAIAPLVRISPNPVHGTARLSYSVDAPCRVSASLIDIFGREAINIISNQAKETGEYSIEFDTSVLPAGIYFLSMKIGERNEMLRVIISR